MYPTMPFELESESDERSHGDRPWSTRIDAHWVVASNRYPRLLWVSQLQRDTDDDDAWVNGMRTEDQDVAVTGTASES